MRVRDTNPRHSQKLCITYSRLSSSKVTLYLQIQQLLTVWYLLLKKTPVLVDPQSSNLCCSRVNTSIQCNTYVTFTCKTQISIILTCVLKKHPNPGFKTVIRFIPISRCRRVVQSSGSQPPGGRALFLRTEMTCHERLLIPSLPTEPECRRSCSRILWTAGQKEWKSGIFW